MAQAVRTGRVTPADELRELLAVGEKRVANVRGNREGMVLLLQEMDRIAALWPQLEAQGMDLSPEAGRWETLQASVDRRAAHILRELRGEGGIARLRERIHPEGTDAPWWRLDQTLSERNRRKVRRTGLIMGGLVLAGVVLYFGFRILFPVDPKLQESVRRVGDGDLLVQQDGNLTGALQEYQRAAELTPDDPGVWLRVGAAHEKLGNTQAADDAYARARALLPDEVDFRNARVSAYFTLGMIDQAATDLEAALAIKSDDALAWYQLATVFEARGQVGEAIAALEQAGAYATETRQDQLTAMARFRMGMLMQQMNVQQPTTAPVPTLTP